MIAYVIFIICALIAGFGGWERGGFGDFLKITFGLSAIVLPFLLILDKKLNK